MAQAHGHRRRGQKFIREAEEISLRRQDAEQRFDSASRDSRSEDSVAALEGDIDRLRAAEIESLRDACTEYWQAVTLGLDPRICVELGDIYYYRLQDPENAMTAYRKAVKLNPRSWEAWYALGQLHEDAAQLRDALHCFKQARTLAPSSEREAPADAVNRVKHELSYGEARLHLTRRLRPALLGGRG